MYVFFFVFIFIIRVINDEILQFIYKSVLDIYVRIYFDG